MVGTGTAKTTTDWNFGGRSLRFRRMIRNCGRRGHVSEGIGSVTILDSGVLTTRLVVETVERRRKRRRRGCPLPRGINYLPPLLVASCILQSVYKGRDYSMARALRSPLLLLRHCRIMMRRIGLSAFFFISRTCYANVFFRVWIELITEKSLLL